MLQQCLPAGNSIAAADAAGFCQKLRSGVLTVGHFARYWTIMKTRKLEPMRAADLLGSLERCMAVRNIDDADAFAIAVRKIHIFYGKAFCNSARSGEWTSFLGSCNLERTKAWNAKRLLTALNRNEVELPARENPEAFVWAARIMALQQFISAEQIPAATAWLRTVGITREQVATWFVETQEGREHFNAMTYAMTEGTTALSQLDLQVCYGITKQEHYARVWLFAQILQLMTDDLNTLNKTARDHGLNELYPD